MLDRQRILDLLAELDAELAESGVHGDAFIVGGAAMTIAYRARPATRDVDAIWEPSGAVRSAAARIAGRHPDLDINWLNDGAKGFLPGPDEGRQRVVYEGEHLSVAAASPEYMLATKLFASRVARDEQDIRTLLLMCGGGDSGYPESFDTSSGCLPASQRRFAPGWHTSLG